MTVTVRTGQKRRPVNAGASEQSVRRACLRPVIETIVRIRGERASGVFAFTAPNSGAGTTYVVNLLARRLAAEMPCSVAIVPSGALHEKEPAKLPQGYVEHAPKIWMAVADRDLEHLPDPTLERLWIGSAHQSFDFVLVDTPSLAAGPAALRLADSVDGVFLVVEAGKTTVSAIERAQELLRPGTGRLKGMILNRRTYAIPRLIYKLL